MPEYHSVVICASQPSDGQVAVYQASSDSWVPAAITAATVTVPQAAIAAFGAVAAETGGTVATADAAVQSGSYVQADVQTIAALANALKAAANLHHNDIGTLITELGALRTKFNTLLAELATAGILTP